MGKLSISKIENPMFVRIVDDGQTLLTVGDIAHLSMNLGVKKPIVDAALPTILKHKFGFSSVDFISKEEFGRYLKRVNDSNSKVRVI